jgi:hypothetical protein
MTEIRWYRSWPKHPSAGPARDHPHVYDHLPRILIDQYDYATAVTVAGTESSPRLPYDKPGFCLLEWDIALSSDERQRFAAKAMQRPDSVLVAPYMLYGIDGNPECAHRFIAHGDPIGEGWPVCETFGFGCIYLPSLVIGRFMQDAVTDLGMTDASFSRYVFHAYGPTTVDWSFHPQHLSGD